ncbi:MAG: DUF3043 domain-containing protein [Microbacteriaceae bacterium]
MAKLGKPDSGTDHEPHADDSGGGKGRPTPTRKEREAAHQRPLVSSDRRASGKAARTRMREQREKARLGMANGDEKYLTLRDKGPQRRYIRDYVDARFSIGELLIPVMFLVIIMTMFSTAIQTIGILVLWGFFLLALVDCILVGFAVNRRLAVKFGGGKLQTGNRWYAAMRALQFRALRLPKPQVKRGQYPS